MADPLPRDGPLVSVVTTFLNPGPFLHEAIASVLAQTWSPVELLLVDDGSTDGSTDIAQAIAAREPAVHYLAHEQRANLGMSVSRNVGVAHARGTYVAFLDADDVFLPDKLERQLACLASHPDVDAVIADTQWWYGWTGDPSDIARDAVRSIRVTAGTYEPGVLIPRLIQRAIRTPATCSVLLRREAFERLGGFEESFRAMYEDQAFFFKLFLHGRTHVMAGVFDRYRQHPDSCCAAAARRGDFSLDGGPSPARERFLEWAADYLRARQGRTWYGRLIELERWIERHPVLAAQAHRQFLRAHATLERFANRPTRAAAATAAAGPDCRQ